MLMAGPGRARRPRRREPYRARGLTFGAKGAPTTRTCSTPSATSPPPSSGCRMFHRQLPRPSRSRAPRPRRSPQHAAGGPRHPTGLFDHHRRAAGAAETGSTSSQVLPTAKMLATDSNRLKDVVGKFLSTVHAAGAGRRTRSGGVAPPASRSSYCGSRRAMAIANRKPVATIAATAPAMILAFCRTVVERIGCAHYLMFGDFGRTSAV